MDEPRDIRTRCSKSENESQIAYIIYLQNLKYDKNKLIYETETDSQITENKLIVTKGENRGKDKLGVQDYQIHNLYKIDK